MFCFCALGDAACAQEHGAHEERALFATMTRLCPSFGRYARALTSQHAKAHALRREIGAHHAVMRDTPDARREVR